MHGHILAILHEELGKIQAAWIQDPELDRGKVSIQITLVNKDNSRPSIIVIDRIRLVVISFLETHNGVWWDPSRQGPCSITQWADFEKTFDTFDV